MSMLDWIANKVENVGKDRLQNATGTREKIYRDKVLYGNRVPITNSDFTPNEIDAMRGLVNSQNKQKGSIQYKDYYYNKTTPSLAESDKQTTNSLISDKVVPDEPIGRDLTTVHDTLGRFNYRRGPQNQIIITDKYDFDPYGDTTLGVSGVDPNTWGQFIKHVDQGSRGMARWLGVRRLPPEKAVPINIEIPALPYNPRR